MKPADSGRVCCAYVPENQGELKNIVSGYLRQSLSMAKKGTQTISVLCGLGAVSMGALAGAFANDAVRKTGITTISVAGAALMLYPICSRLAQVARAFAERTVFGKAVDLQKGTQDEPYLHLEAYTLFNQAQGQRTSFLDFRLSAALDHERAFLRRKYLALMTAGVLAGMAGLWGGAFKVAQTFATAASESAPVAQTSSSSDRSAANF